MTNVSDSYEEVDLIELLSWQEIAFLHLTFDFERDMERSSVVDDDFNLIGLEPLEAKYYINKLVKRDLITSRSEPYNLTSKSKELFSKNVLGEHTSQIVEPLINERRDITGV